MEAEKGVRELDEDSPWLVWSALILYRQILDAIEANGYDNFKESLCGQGEEAHATSSCSCQSGCTTTTSSFITTISSMVYKADRPAPKHRRQEAVDHLANFPSSGEEISQLGIELPTSSLRFGYLSTIIQ